MKTTFFTAISALNLLVLVFLAGCITPTPPSSSLTWYADADADGYGNPAVFVAMDVQPIGYVSNRNDCDDTNAAINPDASEIVDGMDNNCNGQIDETVIPPDPQTIAPTLSTTEITGFREAVSFLYSGSNPIQSGVAPDTIEEKRAAVIRGSVKSQDGTPLPGVTITIKDHPEFGQTVSRADGVFDLAVNGGGTLVLDYEKTAYLPAQRMVTTNWRDYQTAEDVILIQLDSNSSVVNFSNPAAVQVAQGSMVADADGSRQATIVFPADVSGSMILPGGAAAPLTSATVRASEYTLGENGPTSMPGPLPASSAYTYAVELSLDEAIAAGATSVQFDRPVSFYVNNFLGFPVGGAVPVGWYDRDKAAWIPADNGRVIQILSINNGLAVIDVDGSGNPADTAQLATLGFSDEERAELATLHVAGESLWRIQTTHFTPIDLNWPLIPPDDAVDPNQSEPDSENRDDDPDCRGGSIIECQNAVLRERVAVTGTPFTLNYRSDRVPGRKAAYSLDISLSGADIPASLKRIQVCVSIAGRESCGIHSTRRNLRHLYTWNGRDIYGREIQGRQKATVRIGYIYPGYYVEPAAAAQSFSMPSAGPVLVTSERLEIVRWQTFTMYVGAPAPIAAGLGGWTLSPHHAYVPDDTSVYYGDGTMKAMLDDIGLIVDSAANNRFAGAHAGHAMDSASDVAIAPDGTLYIVDTANENIRRVSLDGVISIFAGGWTQGYSGDGGPAIEAQLHQPQSVAIAANGTVYIADTDNNRIRQVTPDGIITTVAGNGNVGFSGDGGPANQANLQKPYDIAAADDGSLYISDLSNFRIRRVAPNGIISTFAGDGAQGSDGDDGPAVDASVVPRGIALGPDGSLYIADPSNHCIRKVGPDGIITTVAGNGFAGFSGDGGPAIDAELNIPTDVAVASNGSIYITDRGNQLIRRVSPDGLISTIAGSGDYRISGDGGPALLAGMSVNGIAFGQDGIYIADYVNASVRRLSGFFGKPSNGEVALPSKDGTQLDIFEVSGRHLRTLDAVTGSVLYQFRYSGEGYLTEIEDSYGNITSIERYGDGTPVAIIAPEGQRTILSTDANGYLASITNPANERYDMIYTEDGLLTSFTDPKNNSAAIDYNNQGRLSHDNNAAGGGWTLGRGIFPYGNLTSMISAMGRTTLYRTDILPNDSTVRTNTYPNGTSSVIRVTPGVQQTETAVDGSVTIVNLGADPRFGMSSTVPIQTTVLSPSGLSSAIAQHREADLAAAADPFSYTMLTETVSVNGRMHTRVFDKTSLSSIYTSPEGRQRTTVFDQQGNIRQISIPGLNTLTYNYDAKGRLSSVVNGSRTTSMTFNSSGYLDTLTDAANQELDFQYDLAGRVLEKNLFDDELVQYQYDDNGNITGVTPPGRPLHAYIYNTVDMQSDYNPPSVANVPASSTQYGYNLDKQLILVDTPDGAITINYDTTTGQKLSMQTPWGRYDYSYSPTTGQLTSINTSENNRLSMRYDGFLSTGNDWAGTIVGSVTRTYDNDFAISTESVNDDFNVTYQYDNDKLLTGAGSLSISRATQNGLITGTTLASLATSSGYNGYAELSDTTATYAASPLYSVSYIRDNIGRITQQQETLQGTTTTWDYDYDLAGRLDEIKTNGVTTTTYTYDANGNRTHVNGALIASYDAQDRLTQYASTNYSYTSNGALLSKTDTASSQTTTYTHDLLGNLRQVVLHDSTTIDYVIDGMNRRIGKKVNGTLQQGFLYKDQLNPVAELDGNNAVVSRFVYGDKPYVPAYMEKGGVTYRIISDHLGSVRLVVNTSNGTIAQRMDYDVWGKVTTDTNPGFQPFGFAGGIYDQHTQLVKFGARDYDAAIGRWVQKDRIGLSGGLNTYAYAKNSPVNYIDPYGLLEGPFGGLCGPEGSDLATWIPDGNAAQACESHDQCYAGEGCYENYSRSQCDTQFFWDLLSDNVNPIDAYIYYETVNRQGGQYFERARGN